MFAIVLFSNILRPVHEVWQGLWTLKQLRRERTSGHISSSSARLTSIWLSIVTQIIQILQVNDHEALATGELFIFCEQSAIRFLVNRKMWQDAWWKQVKNCSQQLNICKNFKCLIWYVPTKIDVTLAAAMLKKTFRHHFYPPVNCPRDRVKLSDLALSGMQSKVIIAKDISRNN